MATVRFSTVRELFEDMHRHVRRTGDSLLPADVVPDFGWAAIGKKADGSYCNPVEERHWVISMPAFKLTFDEFAPGVGPDKIIKLMQQKPGAVPGRVALAEAVLEAFCPKCHLWTFRKVHTDEDCVVRQVLES